MKYESFYTGWLELSKKFESSLGEKSLSQILMGLPEFRKNYPPLRNFSDEDVTSCVLAAWMANRWGRYKLVYNIDEDFFNMLTLTQDSPIYTEFLKRLPFTTFAVTGTKVAAVLMVTVESFGAGSYDIVIYDAEAENDSLQFKLLSASFHDGDTISVVVDKLVSGNAWVRMVGDVGDAVVPEQQQLKEVITGVVNLLYYLASSKPDVKVVPIKKKNRPRMRNGNRVNISNVNVGFRIGSKFRKDVAKITTSSNECSKSDKKRKPITPHVRRAHWHHYWVGEGRKTREVRWVEATYVCAKDSSEIDVVQHDVDGE